MSIKDVISIRNVVGIIKQHPAKGKVLVFSAVGKTTRELQTAGQRAAAGEEEKALSHVRDILRYHEWLLDELTGMRHSDFMDMEAELSQLISGCYQIREFSPRSQDKLLSFGELLSTRLLSKVLSHYQIESELLDSRKMIITDDLHTQASPLPEFTEQALRSSLIPVLDAGAIPVLQGFIGATPEGETTTLGFEGSDYTASLVGRALEAEAVEVWKDVPGMMTADPAVCSGATVISRLSYEEAATLAYLGAKILHKSTLAPVRESGIPVKIKYLQDPGASGTKICCSPQRESRGITSIAFRQNLSVLRLQQSRTRTGTSLKFPLHDILAERGCSPLFQAAGGGEYVVVTRECEHLVEVIRAQAGFEEVSLRTGIASISLVGEEVSAIEDVLPRCMRALSNKKIHLLFFGVSGREITLFTEQDNFTAAVLMLHKEFFNR